MKIIDLLNKIANGEVPKKIKIDNKFIYIHDGIDYKSHDNTYLFDCYLETTTEDMNIEVEIIEEEKKIPEKHINNYGDLIILGQQNNWTQKNNIKTKEMETTGIELNPYVFEAINENFKDIENKIYEIIDYLDYLKSKGE